MLDGGPVESRGLLSRGCPNSRTCKGRDKVSLDLFWVRDESLEDSANLPDPHILAEEIADDLRAALEQVEAVLGDLQERAGVLQE